MSNIEKIANISDDRQKAKEIAYRVQMRREEGDYRSFIEILQEEIDKLKATEDTNKVVQGN